MTTALARQTMATRFEVVLHGGDPIRLRAAAEEALDEIERFGEQLSFYSPASDISRINAQASQQPVTLEPRLFRLLAEAKRLSSLTAGAFDITVAPLMRCWGFTSGSGVMPPPELLEEARRLTGMRFVHLDENHRTIQFERPGMMLDLGSIGKGYALDIAVEILKEAGIEHALVHGGTSTVCAFGLAPEGKPWRIALEKPPPENSEAAGSNSLLAEASSRSADSILKIVALRDESLSVSAVWGKFFYQNGRRYGHVIDPRSGVPVQGHLMSAVILPSALHTDALSTALLVEGRAGFAAARSNFPELKALVLQANGPGGYDVYGDIDSSTEAEPESRF